jgi:hypothetical protein
VLYLENVSKLFKYRIFSLFQGAVKYRDTVEVKFKAVLISGFAYS